MSTIFPRDIFYGTTGPRDAEVMLVGEAWGAEEAAQQVAFEGASGQELNRILADAGFDRDEILCTNVVPARPPGNQFEAFLHPTTEKRERFRGLHAGPVLKDGVARLEQLIAAVNPKLIIGAGNVPLWALTGKASIRTVKGYSLPGGIMNWRGSQITTLDGRPYLPIIHPAAILRNWENRYVTVHDLKARAKTFLKGQRKEWVPVPRTIPYWSPSFDEAMRTLTSWLGETERGEFYLSVDIETYHHKEMACIGLCDNQRELCIPLFYFQGELCRDYWSAEEEESVLMLLFDLLLHPNTRIIGQNFSYDAQYFQRLYGIKLEPALDTMVMHHLLWPGTPKSLDYLSSLYCEDHVYWKDESQDWDVGLGYQDLWKYNCKDVRATYEIAFELREHIKTLGFSEILTERMKEWQVAKEMMDRGVLADRQRKSRMRLELQTAAENLSHDLLMVMPEDLRYTSTGGSWFASPKHQMMIFYEVLGLTPVRHKKTKQPTVDTEALESLAKQAPWLSFVFDRLKELRSIGVFISHFLDAQLSEDGRLRCSFNICGTDTFRWSSSANGFGEGTNLQNIPKGDE